MAKTRGQLLKEKVLEKFPATKLVEGETNPIICRGVLEFNRKIAEASKLAANSKQKFGSA